MILYGCIGPVINTGDGGLQNGRGGGQVKCYPYIKGEDARETGGGGAKMSRLMTL